MRGPPNKERAAPGVAPEPAQEDHDNAAEHIARPRAPRKRHLVPQGEWCVLAANTELRRPKWRERKADADQDELELEGRR